MIIYQIKLPEKGDADEFATFLKDEYLGAIHRGPTRVGQVLDLKLLHGSEDTGAGTHEFLLEVGWGGLDSGGLRIDDPAVEAKFKSYGARLKRLGSFREIGAWEESRA